MAQKHALIIGGTRGIGKAIALHLAQQKAVDILFLNYAQDDENAQKTAQMLQKLEVKVHLLKYNIGFSGEIKSLFEELKTLVPHLNMLIHSAALTTFKPFHTVKPNQWDLTMNISAKSFLQTVQEALPFFQIAGNGKVVAISSTGSRFYNPNYGALGVAKATLESMVQYLAVELASQGIQVNGIVGGLVQGETLPLFPEIETVISRTLQNTPSQRLITPEEVAELAYFLLTQARGIYGQNIVIDGGYCLT